MAAGTEMMALRRLIISQVARNWPQSSSLFKEPSRQLDPSASPLFTRDGCYRRGFRKLINTDCQAANESPEIHDEADCLKAADDISAVKHTATSNLKTSTRHDLAMIFTCKVCETRSVKTASRESYEKGVVVARCGGCNNLHLIADRLGWFGEPGSIEDFLAARGEEVKRASTDTLNLTLEDLAVMVDDDNMLEVFASLANTDEADGIIIHESSPKGKEEVVSHPI